MFDNQRNARRRSSTRHSGTAAYALAWLLLSAIATPAMADEAFVERRQAAFSELDERLERIEDLLDEDRPDWAALNIEAQRARQLTHWLHDAFPAGSADGSRAKDKIWSNWSDFSERLTRLSDAADGLAFAKPDRGQAATKLEAAYDTCRSCHMKYRSLFAWPW